MLSKNLEQALDYRKSLEDIKTFRKGFIDRDWWGPVKISFGSYSMSLNKNAREIIISAIDNEEQMIRNTLSILGVVLED